MRARFRGKTWGQDMLTQRERSAWHGVAGAAELRQHAGGSLGVCRHNRRFGSVSIRIETIKPEIATSAAGGC